MNDFQSDAASIIGKDSDPGFGPVSEAASADRFRAARRAARMWQLENARDCAVDMTMWIRDGVRSNLSSHQQQIFDRTVKDPARSMDYATKALVRCVMAEERLDEDAETRAARQAAEQVERDAKARAVQQRVAEADKAEKKTSVRRAFTNLYHDAKPDLSALEREINLADLFAEFDEDDGDYEDPVVTVAKLCDRLGFVPEAEELPDGRMETAEEARARAMPLARRYYEAVQPAAANRNRVDDAPAPPATAQGPPG